NAKLVVDTLGSWLASAPPGSWWLSGLVVPAVIAVAALLLVILLMPLLSRFVPGLAPIARAGVPAPVGGGVASWMETSVASGVRLSPPALMPAASSAVRRVAIALELGPADAAVLDHVLAMPLAEGAELVLLHVAESAASRFLGPEASDLERREDQQALERDAATLRARGVAVRVELGFGDALAELARMTNEAHVDLLITGSHGHGFIGDIFYGATVSALRHRVKCPVLTVRPKAGDGSGTAGSR